ncbi:MAG TPA: hypothetical protein VK966_04650 [Longimicrobiales bacterium]|nr:hypothetical protein [Longimicrobiales bacterium]
MKKAMMIVMLTALATPFTPQRAEAQECTRGYTECLNDTWDTTGFARAKADVKCFASYLRCIAVE